jgi:hypothetical protein
MTLVLPQLRTGSAIYTVARSRSNRLPADFIVCSKRGLPLTNLSRTSHSGWWGMISRRPSSGSACAHQVAPPSPKAFGVLDSLSDGVCLVIGGSFLPVFCVTRTRESAIAFDTIAHCPALFVDIDVRILWCVFVALWTMGFGHVPDPRLTAPLRVSVFRVIRVRSQKEMVRSNARGVVASVQYSQIGGYWPVMEFPRNAVSCASSPVSAEMSVSPLVMNAAGPFPTSRTKPDLRPETLNRGRVHSVNVTQRGGEC